MIWLYNFGSSVYSVRRTHAWSLEENRPLTQAGALVLYGIFMTVKDSNHLSSCGI